MASNFANGARVRTGHNRRGLLFGSLNDPRPPTVRARDRLAAMTEPFPSVSSVGASADSGLIPTMPHQAEGISS